MTVLDNDETYAMDEFYFSFFSRTREAFTRLQAALDAKRKQEKEEDGSHPPEPGAARPRVSRESTKFLDSVQDTTVHIRSSSPTQEHFDLPRRSTDDGRHHELTDEPELLESGQTTTKRRSFRMSRDTIRQFSFGSLNRRPSRSRSPLRHSFESVERASSGHTTPHAHEPTWTDTGKMLWSKGVDVADWLQQRSSKVSSQVGTMLASPVGTTIQSGVGKVSQLWNGDYSQTQHAKWVHEETAKDMKDQNPEERFQTHFSLPQTEKLLGAYYGYVFRTFPFYGKVYLSRRHLCFRSLLPGIKTKVLFLGDVANSRWFFRFGISRRRGRKRLITGLISGWSSSSAATRNYSLNLGRRARGMTVCDS
jgi:GRAM domain